MYETWNDDYQAYILDESDNYVLGHTFEDALLFHKAIFKRTHVGFHYGDPTCGLIATDESWCITGGTGVNLWFLHGERWIGFNQISGPTDNKLRLPKQTERNWISTFLSKQGCLYVDDMKLNGPSSIQVALDPMSEYASTWLLDVANKTLTLDR